MSINYYGYRKNHYAIQAERFGESKPTNIHSGFFIRCQCCNGILNGFETINKIATVRDLRKIQADKLSYLCPHCISTFKKLRDILILYQMSEAINYGVS